MDNLLFTGASGFLGKNILPNIQMVFDVKTMGLSRTDTYNVGIASTVPILRESFDVVLHAAGKAHVVPKSEEQKKSFFDINYQGTVNLCKALESSWIPKMLFIHIKNIVKYFNKWGWFFDKKRKSTNQRIIKKLKKQQS